MEDLLEELGTAAARAKEEAGRLFRVDVTLGVTAGLFCVILL